MDLDGGTGKLFENLSLLTTRPKICCLIFRLDLKLICYFQTCLIILSLVQTHLRDNVYMLLLCRL